MHEDSLLTKREPLENFDSAFEFTSNFATLNPSFICYCEIRSRNANIKAKQPVFCVFGSGLRSRARA